LPASLERAGLLLEQERYELAEREVRGVLAEEPENPIAHSWLALCLSEKEQHKEALAAAKEAVGLAPDDAYTHYILARILSADGKLKDALPSIEESIALDPDNADGYAVHAELLLRLERPAESLEAAERGLTVDPEHIACNNLRAAALVRLGRRAEAGATIRGALARNPENPATHANMGWTLLHQGKPKEAMEHFREALRLDPTSDWARAGIVEALKARNFIYRWFLAYFLFMARQGTKIQWGIILGAFLGIRLLRAFAASNPAVAPFVTPIVIAYMAFAISSWLAYPVFNLLLFLHPIGRHALTREQKQGAASLGVTMLLALVGLAMWAWVGGVWWELLAMVAGLLCLPIATAFQVRAGWPRIMMLVYTFALAGLVTLGSVVAAMFGGASAATNTAFAFVIGCLLSGLVGNFLNTFAKKR